MISVGQSSSSGLIDDMSEIVKRTRVASSGTKSTSNPESVSVEAAQEDPFGKFAEDQFRLEAVKMRERRLLILGIVNHCVRLSLCVSVVIVLLFTDHPAAVGGSLMALVALLRGTPPAT